MILPSKSAHLRTAHMSSAPATAMHDEFLVDDNPQKLELDADLLSKFISRDGTVNIRGTVPIHVDDPLVLACFEGTDYRPHYRAMRFVHNALDDTEVDDATLSRISTSYRNRPLVMQAIPQQGVFEYTGLCLESTIWTGTFSDSGLAFCTPLSVNPIYTCTGFIPGTYKTITPGYRKTPNLMTVWFEEHQYFMGYVYAVLPPTFRSAYQIDEETKFTWFIGDRSLSVMMGELHEILVPRLNNNSELVCGVLSFIPCDAEVMEIVIVDVSREQDQRDCLWSWPNQFDQIQCLKDDDINGNKWVPCPLVSIN